MNLRLGVPNSGWPRRRRGGASSVPAPRLRDRMLIVDMTRTRNLPVCVMTTMCRARTAAGAIAPSLFKVHHLILIFEPAHPRAMPVGHPIRRRPCSARHAYEFAAITVHVELLPCIRKAQCTVVRSPLGISNLENDVPSVRSAFDLDLAPSKCSDEALVSTLARGALPVNTVNPVFPILGLDILNAIHPG